MKRRMWIFGVAASATVLAASAFAQVADDAKKVFAESAQAMSKVEAMSYKVRKYGTGILKDIIDMDGTVKFWRQPGKPAMVKVEGRIKQPGQQDNHAVEGDTVLAVARDCDAEEGGEEDGESAPVSEDDGIPVNLLIAKQRNGPTGDVSLVFLKNLTRFEDMSPVHDVDVSG